MNLYWPACVQYKTQLGPLDTLQRNQIPNSTSTQGSRSESVPTKADSSAYRNIYAATLDAGHIRLICLSASDNDDGDDSTIHITLESHPDNDCPEYETASYAWGGEEGDSTPCRPVYVGEYWDVLLQTKNCWDLLHYLRPRRGIRFVWIDAIAIDQSNVMERNTQVAKMGSIYRHCSRVVVFLGHKMQQFPDNKSHLRPNHPPRCDFHEVEEKLAQSKFSLFDLLQSRFFSRVWIIQELLLAPSAVFPIHGIEFHGTNLSIHRLKAIHPSWKWENTPAPWFQHMASGAEFLENNPLGLLQQTWRSQATDARDRVFGVMGLLQDGNMAELPKPDYAISTMHTFIGIFAYVLFNRRQTILMTLSSGYDAKLSRPSWLPDWELHDNLQNTPGWPYDNEDEQSEIWREINNKARHHFLGSADRSSDTEERKIFIFTLYELSLFGSEGRSWRSKCFRSPSFEQLQIPWSYEAYIESRWATLSIHLVRVFRISNPPVEIFRQADVRLSTVRTDSCGLFISTSVTAKEVPSEALPCEIFLWLENDSQRIFILFMQKIDTGGVYRLIRCWPCYGVFLIGYLNADHSKELPVYAYNNPSSTPHGKQPVVSVENSPYETLHYSKSRLARKFKLWAESCYGDKRRDPTGFTQLFMIKSLSYRKSNELRILAVYQGFINGQAHRRPNFLDAYMEYLRDTDHNPQVQNGYIELTISREDWFIATDGDERHWLTNTMSKLNPDTYSIITFKRRAVWDFKPLRGHFGFLHYWTRFPAYFPLDYPERFCVRIALDEVYRFMSYSWTMELKDLSRYRRLLDMDETDIFMREPEPGDRFLHGYEFPQAAIDAFDADGRTQRVHIV
ncbi:MAG: hypothetical protein Q9227_000562 [Pyrenula ochraceoflavens]